MLYMYFLLLLLLLNALDIFWPFYYPYNSSGIFMSFAMNLVINLEKIKIFMLQFLIPEYEIFHILSFLNVFW